MIRHPNGALGVRGIYSASVEGSPNAIGTMDPSTEADRLLSHFSPPLLMPTLKSRGKFSDKLQGWALIRENYIKSGKEGTAPSSQA